MTKRQPGLSGGVHRLSGRKNFKAHDPISHPLHRRTRASGIHFLGPARPGKSSHLPLPSILAANSHGYAVAPRHGSGRRAPSSIALARAKMWYLSQPAEPRNK